MNTQATSKLCPQSAIVRRGQNFGAGVIFALVKLFLILDLLDCSHGAGMLFRRTR